MPLRASIYARLVFPVIDRSRYGRLSERLDRFARLERQSIAENQQLQWQSLVRLLRHAYNTAPFYRERFDQALFDPAKLQSPDDLTRLPVLTREDIRQNFDQMWSRKFDRTQLAAAATGGTTSTPVPLLRDPEALAEKSAAQFRFNAWAGFELGDRVLYVWGARQDFAQRPGFKTRMFEGLVMRRQFAPTSLLNEQVLENYRDLLNRHQPKVIYAYPTPLAIFCEYLLQRGGDFHRPATVICTAEPLLASQREAIERALNCKVFEHYGSRDLSMIAAECEAHEGLHLNPHSVYTEFLRVTPASAICDMVFTDLMNYGMPLIRYQINDCAEFATSACACGRGYPKITKIVGRTTDNFYLPNGDVVPGVSLTNRVIKVCPGIKQLQVIQETLDSFTILYVKGPEFSENDVQLLQTNLRLFFSDAVRFTLTQVSDIPREQSGKTRLCISRVAR